MLPEPLRVHSSSRPSPGTTRVHLGQVHSEAWWPRRSDTKRVFKREPGAGEGALIKEFPNQRHAVRHAAWRREYRPRVRRIWRPITARLGNLDKARSQGE